MAGRIPQPFIDDLLERTDLVELIDSRVKLKKTGRNYTACCPFHDEKTPSFSVSPDKQFYHCFGCGASGNAVSFLMDYDRSDFIETIDHLAKLHGLEVPREHNPQAEQFQKAKRSIYDLLEQSNQYFQQQLQQHPQRNKAIDYLKNRGLSGAVTKNFGIGYAPPGWDNLLKELGQSKEQIQLLIDGGMLIEKDDNSGCYDRFRDRLIFPILDNRGRTIGFGGRVLTDEKPKYLNSPETPVFHKQLELYGLYEARQANRHLSRLLMVEGYMDVIALAQFDITYAVATLGTSAGSAHMEKVFRHCSEVVFCFDGDEAGRKAADRALEAVIPLMQAGRQAKFLFLPEGEDPDSLIRKIGKDKFTWHIEQAQTLSEYLYSSHSKNLDLTRTDDKAKLINNIMPSIKALPKGSFQELMLRSLSEKSGLPINDLKAMELSNPPENTFSNNNSHAHKHTPIQRQKLQAQQQHIKRTPALTATALLVLTPKFAEIDHKIADLDHNDQEIKLLIELLEFIKKTPDITTAKIIGYWQSHNKTAITQLLSLELITESPEQQECEYREALAKLHQNKHQTKHFLVLENLKQTPHIRFEDMNLEQRDAFLAIFKKNQ